MNVSNLKHILGVIKVSGIDCKQYLQGQLTNDINQLDTNKYQFSAHLNNKGRILATFIITKVADDIYYLITSYEIIEKIIPRIKMFVLRSKVVIELLSDNIDLLSQEPLFGLSIKLDNDLYLNINDVVDDNEISYISWKKWLINFGVPQIYLNTQESFTPQQVNYDLIGGVNFKKGCYTGQEIVARMHYLGKVKRRMYRYSCDYEVRIGQNIYSPIMDNQVIGEVVEALQVDSHYIGLVSLQPNCIEDAFLDAENTQQLINSEISYMFDIKQEK